MRLFGCLGHMCSQFCSELFHWLSMLRHYVLCRPGLCKAGESESEVTQSCPTLCDPMDCSRPGSSVHGIFQAIVLEWIAISFSRGSSQPRDWTQVSHTVDRRFTIWATREVPLWNRGVLVKNVVSIPLQDHGISLRGILTLVSITHWEDKIEGLNPGSSIY